MNLYKIMFQHFSQKDSEIGVKTYLVANSDEEVYEWLKNDPKLLDDSTIYTSYKYSEEDEKTYEIYDTSYNVIGEETFKERIIRLRGDMFDDDKELTDLYYGLTLYGWELVKENVKPDIIKNIQDCGIPIIINEK